MSTSALDLVESLDAESKAQIEREYSNHVKACVNRGDTPMRPDEFVTSKRPDLEARAAEHAREQAAHAERINAEFRDLMIRNGWGTALERALYRLRTGDDALSGVATE